MYGVHPRLTVLDRNGDAYGLLFLNSAAQVNSETGPGKTSFGKLKGRWVAKKRDEWLRKGDGWLRKGDGWLRKRDGWL
jgi:hypothetical protein